jgi:hypothetical protein
MRHRVSHYSRRAARLLVVACLLCVACDPAKQAGCRASKAPTAASSAAPTPWRGDPTSSISIEETADGGLSWSHDKTAVELQLPGESPSWSHESWSDLHSIRGQSNIVAGDHTADLEVQLLFAPGNPQVALRTDLQLPPDARPAEPINLTLTFPTAGPWRQAAGPDGSADVSPPVTINGWSFPWLKYTADPDNTPITVWGWTGSSVRLTQTRGSHSTLHLNLLSPDQTLPCSGNEPRHLTARATLAWMDTPPVTLASLPNGHPGAVIPVFLPPKSADNPPLWRSGPNDPGDWMERLQTLSFGHSNPDDPRFGNGGLIGRHLGATLTWPADLFDAETFRQLQSSIDSAPLDVAAPASADISDPSPAVRTALDTDDNGSAPGCISSPATEIVVHNGPTIENHLPTPLSPNETVDEGTVSLPTAGGPAIATVAHTDGTRDVLTNALLTSETVDRLAEHRETMVLGIPLIATRNPLVPAFDHGLLTPERYHQWTTQTDFSSALTTLKLATDTRRLGVFGLRRLVDYWHRSRQSSLRWSRPDTLRIGHDLESPIDGYTLHAPDAPADTKGLDGGSIRTSDDGRTHSFRLPDASATELTFQNQADAELSPVSWRVSLP